MTNDPHFCYNCFAERPAGPGPCPRCGHDPSREKQFPAALPPGSILAGRYMTGRILGQGGFGITYLARDLKACRQVAIKEYFPCTLAMRQTRTAQVQPLSAGNEDPYRYGIERFLDEAKLLARFAGHPAIVSVYRYFEENGTAYFVMEYLIGQSLQQHLDQRGGRIPWREAVTILSPILEALDAVHQAGLIHRDVSPDNIFLLGKGGVRLLDFGAARYQLGGKSQSMSVILKHHYAPSSSTAAGAGRAPGPMSTRRRPPSTGPSPANPRPPPPTGWASRRATRCGCSAAMGRRSPWRWSRPSCGGWPSAPRPAGRAPGH